MMWHRDEIGHDEYEDGPWATGHWDFFGPDVSSKDEIKGYIQVEACEQGFLVVWDAETLAFTDRLDAAEWLLGWLGFDDEIISKACNVLASHDIETIMREARTTSAVWRYREDFQDVGDQEPAGDELYNILSDCVAGVDYDEPEDRDCTVAHVALAAWAYTEAQGFDAQEKQYDKLVEAVKEWRGIDDEG